MDQEETFALLDDGATASLIESTLAEKLGLEGEFSPMEAEGIGAIVFSDQNSKRVTATIRGKNCTDQFTLKNLRTVQDLKLPSQSINVRRLRQDWKYLSDVDLDCLKNAKPMLLIGQDNMRLIAGRELVEGPENGPMMSLTKLGWVIHGNNCVLRERVDKEFVHLTVKKEDELHNLVKSYWSLETLGIKYAAESAKFPASQRAEEILRDTTRRIGSRFETGLLWKHDNLQLPESKQMALKRLGSVEKKMDANPDYAAHYCTKIEDMINKGYATKLSLS